MKDQYAGDINDYRKYGLLRGLTGGTGLSLGVCWMLTAPDGRSDGRHTDYLSGAGQWRGYDPALFEAMRAVVHGTGGERPVRRVAAVEESGILGRTRFWSDLVPDDAVGRERYFAGVSGWSRDADLLFFDPDNGLEVASTRYGSRGSSKYLYWREVREAYARGHSLLIYQHFPRRERVGYVAELSRALGAGTGAGTVLAAVTSNVVFFLVASPEHEGRCAAALGDVERRWGGQIRVRGNAAYERGLAEFQGGRYDVRPLRPCRGGEDRGLESTGSARGLAPPVATFRGPSGACEQNAGDTGAQ